MLIGEGVKCKIHVLVLSVTMVRLVSGVWGSLLTREDVDAALAYLMLIHFVYWCMVLNKSCVTIQD